MKDSGKWFRPLLLGLGLAYMLTGLLDRPTPVRIDSEKNAAAKTVMAEPKDRLVLEKNIFKLGTALSLQLLDPELDAANSDPVLGLWNSATVFDSSAPQPGSAPAQNGTWVVRATVDVNATAESPNNATATLREAQPIGNATGNGTAQ